MADTMLSLSELQETEKPFKGYILEWKLRKVSFGEHWGRQYITGIFADHPEFRGKRGYTSLIVKMEETEYYWEVETMNSRYRLSYEDEEPDREFWDMS